MAEETNPGKSLSAKIRLGALIGAGCILLWFLAVNLTATWELSLWPIAYLPAPGTLFIFIFLVAGGVFGFVACFLLLRSGRFDAAVLKLVEAGKKEKEEEKACEPGASSDGGVGAGEGGEGKP